MTNYAIDITELWPPLKSFNAVRGARVLTPEAARDILTHSNHPRVMDELVAKTGQALAGGADYGLWREVVLGIVAGRAGRDTTREKMRALAEANGDGEAFAAAAGQKVFIGLGGMRRDVYDARGRGKNAELNNMELADYADIVFAADVERISIQKSNDVPAAVLDFRPYPKLEVLALGLSALSEEAELKLPQGIRWLDVRGNVRLLGDLSGFAKLETLYAGLFDRTDFDGRGFALPPHLRELSLPGATFPRDVLAQLKGCRDLKRLMLSGNKTTAGEKAVYFELPEGIEELELSSVRGLHGDMFKLEKYRHLKKVDLSHTNLEFRELRLPEGIEELTLNYTGGLARDVLDLSRYGQLKKIGLRTCRPSFKEVLVPAGCAVDRGIESGLEKPDVKVRKTGGLNAGKIFGRLFGRGGNGG